MQTDSTACCLHVACWTDANYHLHSSTASPCHCPASNAPGDSGSVTEGGVRHVKEQGQWVPCNLGAIPAGKRFSPSPTGLSVFGLLGLLTAVGYGYLFWGVFGCKQKNPHHFSACVVLNYSGRKGLNSSPFLILSYITCITFLLCYCIFFFVSLHHTFKILPFLEKLPKGKKWSKA